MCDRRSLVGFWIVTGILVSACSTGPRVPKVLANIDISGMQGEGIIQVSPRTDLVYAGCSGQAVVIKGTKLMSMLPTGIVRCDAMAADKTGGWVYALSTYSDTVTVIRETQVITALETIGHLPMALTVAPNGWAYVVSGDRHATASGEASVEGNVMAINGPKIIGNLSLGEVRLTHVVADPATGYVYAGAVGGEVVVLKGLQEIGRFQVGRPEGRMVCAMSVDPRTGDVYVLTTFDLTRFKNGQLIDSMEINFQVGKMIVDPKTGDVYIYEVGVPGGAEVLVVHNMKEVTRVRVGRGPALMDNDPASGNVYVTNSSDNTVTVIQGTESIATIEVGLHPWNVGVNPANGWVYVTNEFSNTISVLGFP